ncbi:hypothetical protein TRVL_07971 [Trypanosoma vivax]|nr:hypothetical protein TRVL_07971 [Trypanosoma vivax]
MGQARMLYDGGASILVRDGVGVEVGVLDRKVPERTTAALRFSANVSLTITSAYLPRKADVSSESLDTLLGASGPLVVAAEVSSDHVLCDPLRPSDDKRECTADWCVRRRKRFDAHFGQPEASLLRCISRVLANKQFNSTCRSLAVSLRLGADIERLIVHNGD